MALAGLLLYGGVAWRFAGSGLFPGGDEPHYLVLAQSLWRDHDFKIENNHARGDTLEYYRLPLQPHYLERGRDGEIYSIHPVGLALVAAPIYAAGGYYGVVAFLVCCAAAAAAGLWLAALRLTGSARAATLAWVGAAASAPFVFNSITVYPEIPAAACAMAAYLIATRRGGIGQRPGLAAACGAVLALLPWLSSKYSLMMAAIAVLALGRLWLPMADDVGNGTTRGHVPRRAGRPVRATDPRVARPGPADGRQRRAVDGVLQLDLGLAVPVGGLRHAASRPVGVPGQGRAWPAVRPGIRHRPGGADLRGVAGRARRDAAGRTHARGASPRRSPRSSPRC